MQHSKATRENPITCWLCFDRKFGQVTWTPPGEHWPRERIEKTRLPSWMLQHYDKPDRDHIERYRKFYRAARQAKMAGDPSNAQYLDARMDYLGAWLNIHDPLLDGDSHRGCDELCLAARLRMI